MKCNKCQNDGKFVQFQSFFYWYCSTCESEIQDVVPYVGPSAMETEWARLREEFQKSVLSSTGMRTPIIGNTLKRDLGFSIVRKSNQINKITLEDAQPRNKDWAKDVPLGRILSYGNFGKNKVPAKLWITKNDGQGTLLTMVVVIDKSPE